MKRLSFWLLIICLSMFLLVGCNGYQETPSDYKEFNKTIENYFLALVEKDYYTMKQYLSEDWIKQSPIIQEAKETDNPIDSEMKEKMGNKYSIKGFDYFKEYGEIYYSIEYFNYKRNDTESLVLGVRKENDEYKVFGIFGNGGIGGSHVKEFNNGGYFTISNIKKAMKNYPDNTFVVKEYPEE